MDRLLREERPCIFVGGASDWPASSRWDLDYLKAATEGIEIPLLHTRLDDLRARSVEVVSFAEALDRVFGPPSPVHALYINQLSASRVPALARDIVVPEAIRGRLETMNLWIGTVGNVSLLHYDSRPNLLAQVSGTKDVILYDRRETDLLYPYPILHSKRHFSRVGSIARADQAKYPATARANRHLGTIGPGDILYIPTAWWHEVETRERGISVNLFWRRSLRDELRRSILRVTIGMWLGGVAGRAHRGLSRIRDSPSGRNRSP
jgi:hypothetical protein